jgi:hypothetical protein
LITECIVKQFTADYDAVLSQHLIQHGENLRQSNKTALYQTGNHLDVTNRCTVNLKSAIIIAFFITA